MIVSKYRNNIFRDLIGCLYSKLTYNLLIAATNLPQSANLAV